MPEKGTYRVVFEAEAEEEILASYYWGLHRWGEYEAEQWLRELYSGVFDRLTSFPFSCPVAPESDETNSEIRQYLFRRYRILFEINNSIVVVLHIAGPFHEETCSEEDQTE